MTNISFTYFSSKPKSSEIITQQSFDMNDSEECDSMEGGNKLSDSEYNSPEILKVTRETGRPMEPVVKDFANFAESKESKKKPDMFSVRESESKEEVKKIESFVDNKDYDVNVFGVKMPKDTSADFELPLDDQIQESNFLTPLNHNKFFSNDRMTYSQEEDYWSNQ